MAAESEEGGSKAEMKEKPTEILNFKDNFHPCFVLKNLNKILQDKKLFDVTLQVDKREIRAHRLVLAANSLYFYTMFTNGMAESLQERVVLREVDFASLQQLVNFCYTSEIEINEQNVQSILSAANLLQFDSVIETCCGFLKNELQPENCLGICDFAEHHNCVLLKSAAESFIENHFLEVVNTEEFLLVGKDQLLCLLSSDNLNVSSEKDVFESAMIWVKYDIDSRKCHLPDIIRNIRLPLLPPKELIDCIESADLVHADNCCMRIISNAKNYHLLPDRRDQSTLNTKERLKLESSKLYIIGGEVGTQVFSDVDRYDFDSESWESVAPMLKQRDGAGVTSYSGFIYVAGGCDGDVALSSVECYSLSTNTWSYVHPMAYCRHAFSLVELEGWLYAAGGSDFVSYEYDCVERYDPIRDSWSSLANMSAKREGLSMVTLDHSLYAIGGDSGDCILNSMERYDPRIGKWSECMPMYSQRRYFGASVMREKLYVLGGSDYEVEHSSVECFDPRMNRWMVLTPLIEKRESPAAVTLDDSMILAIGGAHSNQTTMASVEVCSVECYCPLTNSWKEMMQLKRPLEGIGALVL